MNPTLSVFPTQTNTQSGAFQVLAGEDLTDKEGLIVVLTHDTGVPEVVLPGAITDPVEYLLLEGGADGEFVTVFPLTRDTNVRVVVDGTCNPGDALTLAAIDGTHDGMVRKLPAAAGDYLMTLRAEEAGVDGQHLKCRLTPGPVTVTVEE